MKKELDFISKQKVVATIDLNKKEKPRIEKVVKTIDPAETKKQIEKINESLKMSDEKMKEAMAQAAKKRVCPLNPDLQCEVCRWFMTNWDGMRECKIFIISRALMSIELNTGRIK